MNDWNDSDWPRFLIGDTETRTFIVHLHRPRFVGEMLETGDGAEEMRPTFIDEPAELDATAMARLMREAGDFYAAEIEQE